jgi:hypothetical protein
MDMGGLVSGVRAPLSTPTMPIAPSEIDGATVI